MAATGFINIFGPDNHTFMGIRDPLRAVRRIAANDANGESFSDVFGDGQKLGDGFERLSPIVLIESCNDDAFASIGECLAHVNEIGAEELAFIDADDLCIFGKFQNLGRAVHNG